MKLYTSYSFKDKDPVIDEQRTLVQEEAKRLNVKPKVLINMICDQVGMSASTPKGWFYGKTRKPQSASIEAFGRGLGYKRVWVKLEKRSKKN